jgi:hypothetical protein
MDRMDEMGLPFAKEMGHLLLDIIADPNCTPMIRRVSKVPPNNPLERR